ncbi:hypothetical protein Cme02nite_28680 [Catellatospora methionotrophica]|uniref:DUF6286 domain-containing protein n=1 Tax=Catellatospora methionotrophica TaxID=121620 RepID=A0A8J3PEF3_9ACTN|nr:DUF6286 domain-containing protein [Catellatospora methionotrophica]GIG14536.1 hypothetical protein Cme02nite_28680 [Catellatospora methionotrophica]
MRRLVNRLLALIACLALITAATLVIAEIAAAALGRAPVLVDWPSAAAWAGQYTWGQSRTLAVSLLLLAAGLALVLGQLWPSRSRRLPLNSHDPATDLAVTRRTLARDVSSAVSGVEGVEPGRVRIGRSSIAVQATAPAAGDSKALAEQVENAISGRLERLRLRRTPRLAVKLTRRA